MSFDFPQIRDLPAILFSDHWTWTPTTIRPGFWIGTDENGHRWLTKLRGRYLGYRELVFARIAQLLGWSCQSSAFVRLSSGHAELLQVEEQVHVVSWFLDEHAPSPCGPSCPLITLDQKLNMLAVDPIEVIFESGIERLTDWPRGEIASAIFGGIEPPGRLLLGNHHHVMVDCELMFATGPTEVHQQTWLRGASGQISKRGAALAAEVCLAIANLSDKDLDECLSLPPDVRVTQSQDVRERLLESRNYVRKLTNSSG